MRRGMIMVGTLLLLATGVSGCANFQRLGRDVERMERSYLLGGMVTNAEDFESDVWVAAVKRGANGEVVAGVRTKVANVGLFAFSVEGAGDWYVAAYADRNDDGKYDDGEPAWIHVDAGRPAAVVFDPVRREVTIRAKLAAGTVLPADLLAAARTFAERNPPGMLEEANIPLELGEAVYFDCQVPRAADGTCPHLTLQDERFSEEAGRRGLWEPLSDPIRSGVGLYVLGEYDPTRVPVLFVYGAGGSAQNWRAFFEAFDDGPFQPWFYRYPTGQRLGEMGAWLHGGMETLASYFGVERFHVVAHSQGGLVARAFLLENLAGKGRPRVDTFVSISTPWNGHPMAEKGAEGVLVAIPSWHDLTPGSPFIEGLFAESLRGKIGHHLLFGFRGNWSLVQEASNDGAVSVASQLKPAAQADAVRLYGFDRSHNGILSDPEVIEQVRSILVQSE